MIITESDRIVLIAILAGFISGSCQSVLKYAVDEQERQIYRGRKFVAKFFYSGFSLAVILGVMVFVLSVWDTEMSFAELNRFTVAMAAFFAVTPLSDRFWSFIFARFKISEPENTNK